MEMTMKERIIIELDDTLLDLLEQRVTEINSSYAGVWTPETLAASFLTHVLIDTIECECSDTVH